MCGWVLTPLKYTWGDSVNLLKVSRLTLCVGRNLRDEAELRGSSETTLLHARNGAANRKVTELFKRRSALLAGVGLAAITVIPAQAAITKPSDPRAALEKVTKAALELPAVVAKLVTDAPSEIKPGTPIHVTGSLLAQSSKGVLGALTPATYSIRVYNEDGSVDHTYGPFKTLTGKVDAKIPAEATEGINPTEATNFREDVAVSVIDVKTLLGKLIPDAGAKAVTVAATTAGLTLANNFVSSVGWTQPGDVYPFSIKLTNRGAAKSNVVVTLAGVDGMTLTGASSGNTKVAVTGNKLTWKVGTMPKGSVTAPITKVLSIFAKTDTLTQDPQIVWKNLSTTAKLTFSGGSAASTSHGPKVIPPGETYKSARFGDRPFPVIPVDYVDHKHRAENTGSKLAQTINDANFKGSTFQLYQEMSLKQLYPHGTVPSAGIASRPYAASDDLHFSKLQVQGTCHGVTLTNPSDGSPLPGVNTDRIKDGWYQLPGTTDYYGDDKFVSSPIVQQIPVGLPVPGITDIDSACGPTAKAAYDAAVISDPDIDYSDYDTDKDGVVDFFEVIFTGLGGHGVSQLGCALALDPAALTDPDQCGLGEVPPLPYYDNIWPHSSTLTDSYTDPATGLTGYVTKDQLKDLEGRPLYYTNSGRGTMTTKKTAYKVFVRIGPYNVNPETALAKASVISHEYGHSLGLPDFYSTGSRSTYGDFNLMATDKSQSMDIFSRQDMGWVVPKEINKGTTNVPAMKDSKINTHSITWHQPDGKPYTLTGPTVSNAEAYTVKVPGKKLIAASKLKDASPTHAWYSGSGNGFGCAPSAGHNLDINLPQLKNVPAGTKVTATFKSSWDIEWDFDYGFVMTGKYADGGVKDYQSVASANGYTTPASQNTNSNACQSKYGNGLTGTSGSAKAGTTALDRLQGTVKDAPFIPDSYDISSLAGSGGVLRFSYSTDPGLARPGWFIDDLKVVAGNKVIYQSNFEKDKGPDSPNVYNGGCKEGGKVAQICTHGWQYVSSSENSTADRGYYFEMRDRSGFDFDGKGQNDRDAIGFKAGGLLVYTDETHGYGNAGTDDPPAQSPLDAHPEVGNDNPNLNDATFKDGEVYDDTKRTDNYLDPASESGNWEFRFNCLKLKVNSLTGDENGPDSLYGVGNDLRGNVTFTRRAGCGLMDYGFGTNNGKNTAPTAKAEFKQLANGKYSLNAMQSSDDTTDPFHLQYAWDLNGDGVTDSTASGLTTLLPAGISKVTLTVTDASGAKATSGLKAMSAGQINAIAKSAASSSSANAPVKTPTTVVANPVTNGGSSNAIAWIAAILLAVTAGAHTIVRRRPQAIKVRSRYKQ